MLFTPTLLFHFRYYACQLVCYVQVAVWRHEQLLNQQTTEALLGLLHWVTSAAYIMSFCNAIMQSCRKRLEALRMIVIHSTCLLFATTLRVAAN